MTLIQGSQGNRMKVTFPGPGRKWKAIPTAQQHWNTCFLLPTVDVSYLTLLSAFSHDTSHSWNCIILLSMLLALPSSAHGTYSIITAWINEWIKNPGLIAIFAIFSHFPSENLPIPHEEKSLTPTDAQGRVCSMGQSHGPCWGQERHISAHGVSFH